MDITFLIKKREWISKKKKKTSLKLITSVSFQTRAKLSKEKDKNKLFNY